MRAFLAVPCGEQLARAVTTVLDGWRAGPGGRLPVRWTGAKTWHLTLQFLGDWPPERLAGLQSALAQVRDVPPFTVRAGGLGAFPDLKGPRVLFLHMGSDGRAADLAHRVRTVVGETWPDGPQDTRPFRGHLTLARIKTKLSRSDINLLRELQFGELPPVPVTGYSLLASELGPTGPRYTELAFFPLRK
jgi:2'-5' RNA ligase